MNCKWKNAGKIKIKIKNNESCITGKILVDFNLEPMNFNVFFILSKKTSR